MNNNKSGFALQQNGDLQYYTIPSFEQTGLVKHGFSTRLGGVSTGECSTLNLGFKKKDSREAVLENFKILTCAIGVDPHDLVFSDQVHKDGIAIVGVEDREKGIFKESDICEFDGLMTNEPRVALVTFYADCVPLFFLDPVQKVIALSHSGWRGTAARIGAKTIQKMHERYGTRMEDCLVGIGPSIGSCCFEVDLSVAEAFQNAFPQHPEIVTDGKRDKYYVDLWQANRLQLKDMGVPGENITIAGQCTCCHRDVFFSHRGDKGHTGSLAGILMLR